MDDEFRFKHFSLKHGRSSMKIGVDSVLIGAWASHPSPHNILDVGTGCGVIAMMMSYRFPEAQVLGIDIDKDSVEEAMENISKMDKGDAIRVMEIRFDEFLLQSGEKYDLIVSNPPYFLSGIINPATTRERARHQGSLSPYTLIESCNHLLSDGGRLAMIFPFEMLEKVKEKVGFNGLKIIRECLVRDNIKRPFKRVMIEIISNDNGKELQEGRTTLTLFDGAEPTEEYRQLCKDFYLKF